MNRDQKSEIVTELKQRFAQAQVALLAEQNGLTVAEVTNLRKALRAVDGEFKVAKNTLARRAIVDTKFAALDSALEGPSALVLGYKDPVAVAKVLVKFAEDHNKLQIRGGVIDGAFLQPKAVTSLAALPSREVLLAMLLGLLQAPASQLLRTIQEPGAQLTRLIDRVRAKRSEAPAEA